MSAVLRWGFVTTVLGLLATLGVHGRQETLSTQEPPELVQIDPSPGKQAGQVRTYIVRMVDEPVASYTGTRAGFRATKPAKGQRLDPRDPAVINDASFLVSTHDDALGRVGGRKLYDYAIVLNGFSAVLTPPPARGSTRPQHWRRRSAARQRGVPLDFLRDA